MNNTLQMRRFVLAFALALAPALAQTPPANQPPPAKGPDKEVADKLAVLKDVVADKESKGDKKFAHDAEGVEAIDKLLIKSKAGLDAKDQAAIVKGLENVLTGGKLRPPDNTVLYVGAVVALGYCGVDGAKVLHDAYVNKRFPEKKEWVPFREQVLKNLGRTKDESQIKFLTNEALRSPEPALSAAAGEALGNFEESKEVLRKEIVSDLIKGRGEIEEKASQIGTNIEAQNAKDRLATLGDKWNTTLAKLTKQNFTTFREWQTWHNKNKSLPW
jgi:hypothetical protein